MQQELPRAARWKPTALPELGRLKPSQIYNTYWRFAAERQCVFFRRFEGSPAPWTQDPVMRAYKFTNVYRASDRVSQYLIRQRNLSTRLTESTRRGRLSHPVV